MNIFRTSAVFLLLTSATIAHAQGIIEGVTLIQKFLPSKNKDAWPMPEINLTETASRAVANDRLAIVFFAEEDGATIEAAAQKVNVALSAAIKKSQEKDKVRIQSEGYHVVPQYDPMGLRRGWKAHAELSVEVPMEKSALLDNIGDGLAVKTLRLSVSDELHRKTEQELIQQAVQGFLLKGQAVADAIGFCGIQMTQATITHSGSDNGTPHPMPAQARTLESAIPVEAGTSRLEVAVSGMVRMVRDGCDKK